MVINNFSASWISFWGKKIYDAQGNSLSSIHYSKEVLPFAFERPKLRYNIIEESSNEKQPLVKEIHKAKLESLGWHLVGIPLNRNERWCIQRVQHKLIKSTNPLLNVYRKCSPIAGMKILYDEANLKIKLVAKSASPQGESEWLQV